MTISSAQSFPAFADYVTPYGGLDKIDAFGYLDYLKTHEDAPRKEGKVILVTADTPLKASRGEGKTTTTIALIDALRAREVDAAAVLRQPSMGITAAGSKGGASGGGKASLSQAELADWGLTGEMARIADAQNLLVAFCEKAVDEGVLDRIFIPRVSETPSRSLRSIGVDGGKLPERVVITPACELMQIVVLSRSAQELADRIGSILAGSKEGKPIAVRDFVDVDRIVRVVGNAVQPAYMETAEGSPVYIHCGPFANVSLGIPGLSAVDLACSLHDLVVVEAGYGADAGAQKWLDIAARESGAQWPAAAVVVTRASTWRDDPALQWRYPFHVRRLESLGIPTFPLINLWAGEDDQVPALRRTASDLGFRDPIIGNLFRDGGEGIKAQLDDFISASGPASASISDSGHGFGSDTPHASHRGMPLLDKVAWTIENAYGVPADRIRRKEGFDESLAIARNLAQQAGIALDDLALCAIKSPATMTDDDSAFEGERTVTLKKVSINAGSGVVSVNLTTSLTTPMPKIV
ncbi:formate-tetrahydrofolate ligase [Parascardovia denticolens IPLA 20019]|uniref:formate--tetrahydrofolate ligase n=1 Tax=Parascardovia denticolens TaxID=78258 RepID=UPI000266A95A|nr:formate--tetrahydrofolate ligase [Parascardovia denticolens]EIT88470.1 formate-tetrahydrofolate ligase [Parascardovia denticolens IPLA 20019]